MGFKILRKSLLANWISLFVSHWWRWHWGGVCPSIIRLTGPVCVCLCVHVYYFLPLKLDQQTELNVVSELAEGKRLQPWVVHRKVDQNKVAQRNEGWEVIYSTPPEVMEERQTKTLLLSRIWFLSALNEQTGTLNSAGGCWHSEIVSFWHSRTLWLALLFHPNCLNKWTLFFTEEETLQRKLCDS